MAIPSDSPGFKELLREWNQKLADSGFVDIEVMFKGEPELRLPSGTRTRYEKMDESSREIYAEYRRRKEVYAERLSLCVAAQKFEDPLEESILTLYAAGVMQTSIQEILKIPGHRCKIYGPIYKWLKAWGLK